MMKKKAQHIFLSTVDYTEEKKKTRPYPSTSVGPLQVEREDTLSIVPSEQAISKLPTSFCLFIYCVAGNQRRSNNIPLGMLAVRDTILRHPQASLVILFVGAFTAFALTGSDGSKRKKRKPSSLFKRVVSFFLHEEVDHVTSSRLRASPKETTSGIMVLLEEVCTLNYTLFSIVAPPGLTPLYFLLYTTGFNRTHFHSTLACAVGVRGLLRSCH